MRDRERLASRLPHLRARARLNARLRRFFELRGYLEIEAPIAVPSPGLEVHLDAFEVTNVGAQQRYLITSPEYQMKRLVGAGLPKIYSLGKVFRRAERGRMHNPEFTMLEFYADYHWDAIAEVVSALVADAAVELLGAPSIRLRDGRVIELGDVWPRRSVRSLMAEHANVSLDGDESTALLREKLRGAGHALPAEGASWDDLFFTVFLDVIEPKLAASDRPTIVHDWPLPLGALARKSPADPRVVERFEAYIPMADGVVELCNGFGELTDPVEQRARLESDLEKRAARGLPAYPIDERFLAALADLPFCSGVAIGVDRLLMCLLGVDDIAQVLPFAVDEL